MKYKIPYREFEEQIIRCDDMAMIEFFKHEKKKLTIAIASNVLNGDIIAVYIDGIGAIDYSVFKYWRI